MIIWCKNVVCLLTAMDLSRIYSVGFGIGLLFFIQVLSGFMLSWLYLHLFENCWYSVLQLYLDVVFGFFVRSMHILVTSAIYLLLYIHLGKVLLLFLVVNNSMLVWFFGYLIYLLCIVIAFLGYVLPMTQMSYWGLTVFSNLLATVPVFGVKLCEWFWTGEYINVYSVVKVHSMHIVFPFLLLFVILMHFFCLHICLSSDLLDRFVCMMERVYFNFWFFMRDICFFLFFVLFVVYMFIIWWSYVFHEESYVVADALKTSEKVIPEWFFLSFFGVIKSVPMKFAGVVLVLWLLWSMFFFSYECYFCC